MGNYTSPDDEALFASIGRLTISCAHMELAIDAIVHAFFHRLGNPANDKEEPRAITRKVKYLKQSIMASGFPDGLATSWLGLLEDALEVNDDRNDVIHGAVTKHEEGTGTATFTRRQIGSSSFDSNARTLNAGDITLIAVRANKLATPLFKAALALDEFYREQGGRA
ncbi:hypothetical protein [Hyphomonas sp.]|jgi:hypothetical protein|uniref:hypothetical protein n=1 Tax=Hyphomonas sp. TaxID=87 RepID=UPI0032D95626